MSSRRPRQPSLVARLRDALRADDTADSRRSEPGPPGAPRHQAPQAQGPSAPASPAPEAPYATPAEPPTATPGAPYATPAEPASPASAEPYAATAEPVSEAPGAPGPQDADARRRPPGSRRWRWEPRSPRVRWGAVRRQAWIPLLGVLALGAGGYVAAISLNRPFSAGATLLVDSGARNGTPGDASDASVLAPTLATAIQEDAQIRAAVAAATGRRLATVGKDIAVTNDDGQTALVKVRYRDGHADAARAGAEAIVRAATSPTFAANTLGGRSPLIAVTGVRAAERTDPVTPALMATLGGLLGLFLGLAIARARERRRPRVDDLAALERAAGCAASRFDSLGPRSCAALLDRWCEAGGESPVTVALVPATTDVQRLRPDVASALVRGDAEVSPFAWSDRRRDDLELRVLPAVRGAGHAPLLSVDEDVSVVVVTPGTPVADVRATTAMLTRLDLPPVWALLARRRAKGASASHDGETGAPPSTVRSEADDSVLGDAPREPVG